MVWRIILGGVVCILFVAVVAIMAGCAVNSSAWN